MTKIEERVQSLEQEVAGMKVLLRRSASGEKGWENTVGVFESDPLFREALRLGREYRENQPQDEHREGA